MQYITIPTWQRGSSHRSEIQCCILYIIHKSVYHTDGGAGRSSLLYQGGNGYIPNRESKIFIAVKKHKLKTGARNTSEQASFKFIISGFCPTIKSWR